MELTCKKKACGRTWEYKGKAPFYATCPCCYTKVKIIRSDQLKTIAEKMLGI